MSSRRPVVRTRVVVAAAVLATVGLACVFVVLLLILLLGSLSSEGPADMDLGWALAFGLNVAPAIAWLMLASAVMLHARLTLGRWLALLVALLLALSPVAAIVFGLEPDSAAARTLLLHAFLLPGRVSWLPLVHLALGSLIAWAVVTGWPRHPETSSSVASADLVAGQYLVRRPRSVARLAAALALVGIYALVPIAIGLAGVAAPADEGFVGLRPVRLGALITVTTLIAGLALFAAHALATRQRVALLITVPAGAIGVAWASLWGLLLLTRLLEAVAPDGEGQPLLGLLLVVTTLGLLGGLIISALVVTVRYRAWFEPAIPGASPSGAEKLSRSGRRWLVGTIVAEVAVAAALILIPPTSGDDERLAAAPRLRADDVPSAVAYHGVYYERIAWATVPASDLEPIEGGVDLIDELEEPDHPPTAYVVADVPAGMIIAEEPGRATSMPSSRHVGLYAAEDERKGPVDLPTSLCPLVDLTTVERGRCAPPDRLVYGDHWYARDITIRVPSGQLTPAGVDAQFDVTPAAHVPTAISLISGVDPAIAVALATSTGGLVYRAIDRFDEPAPELCGFVRQPQDASSECAGPG